MKEVFPDREEAYQKSLSLLKKCSTSDGFIASLEDKANYKRIWGRDSMICLMAALLSGDKELLKAARASLQTLSDNQYKHGQIPSNVDVVNKKISYGGSTGRIDATLWFIVGFGQYVKRTNDLGFLRKHYKKIKKSLELSHLYEFNEKGFIYVPKGGDWADEYVQEGYVLYDEILYFQAMKEFIHMRNLLGKKTDLLLKKVQDMKKKILVNFWLEKKNKNSRFVYQQVLFDKYAGKERYKNNYLLPYFSPSGYGFRFDGFGNSLALCLGVLSDDKKRVLEKYIRINFSAKTRFLLPSFYPVITSRDYDWVELKNSYSYVFRNKPNEYHNGGLWPVITGFYAAALARSDVEGALQYLDGINLANSLNGWGFKEFINGKNFKARGTSKEAWSAAAGVIGYHAAVKGEKLFL